MQIKKVSKEKVTEYFKTVKEAAESVNSKMDKWKIEMLIIDAINNNKRAFQCNWYLEG